MSQLTNRAFWVSLIKKPSSMMALVAIVCMVITGALFYVQVLSAREATSTVPFDLTSEEVHLDRAALRRLFGPSPSPNPGASPRPSPAFHTLFFLISSPPVGFSLPAASPTPPAFVSPTPSPFP